MIDGAAATRVRGTGGSIRHWLLGGLLAACVAMEAAFVVQWWDFRHAQSRELSAQARLGAVATAGELGAALAVVGEFLDGIGRESWRLRAAHAGRCAEALSGLARPAPAPQSVAMLAEDGRVLCGGDRLASVTGSDESLAAELAGAALGAEGLAIAAARPDARRRSQGLVVARVAMSGDVRTIVTGAVPSRQLDLDRLAMAGTSASLLAVLDASGRVVLAGVRPGGPGFVPDAVRLAPSALPAVTAGAAFADAPGQAGRGRPFGWAPVPGTTLTAFVVLPDDDASAGSSWLAMALAALVPLIAVAGWLAFEHGVAGPIDRLRILLEAEDRPQAGSPTARPASTELHALRDGVERMIERTRRIEREAAAVNGNLAHAVARSTAELTRSNEQLQQYARVLAHDLREPLRAVRVFAELLRDGRCTSAEQGDYAAIVTDNAARMQTMIDGLLSLAAVQAERPTGRVDLAEAAREAIAALRATIDEHRARFEIGPLPTVVGSPLQLAQLFQNLFANSIRHHGGGAPWIRIREVLTDDPRRVVVEVTDDGPGFDADAAERLFEPFYRGRGGSDGIGLGLTVCRAIVEAAGGRISAGLAPGGGARFTFELPAAAGVARPAPVPRA